MLGNELMGCLHNGIFSASAYQVFYLSPLDCVICLIVLLGSIEPFSASGTLVLHGNAHRVIALVVYQHMGLFAVSSREVVSDLGLARYMTPGGDGRVKLGWIAIRELLAMRLLT